MSISNSTTNPDIHYQKRKNTELFNSLEKKESLFLSNTQNYIPIYNKFFALNENNYNNINLNHKWYIQNILNNSNVTNNKTHTLFHCRIKNNETNKVKDKNIFIKLAPLLDPFKYLIGKYNVYDQKLYNLPHINSSERECHTKLLDINNSAYVDGLFVYLSSILNNNYNFKHGLEYYGSFLSIKNNYTINVFDDLEFLNTSEFFNKNKNNLFKIDQYEHLFKNEKQKLKTLKIDYNSSARSNLSLNSINNELFENLFEEDSKQCNKEKNDIDNDSNSYNELKVLDLNNDLLNIAESKFNSLEKKDTYVDLTTKITTLKTNSSCSSRTSHTYTNDELDMDQDINSDNEYNSKSENDSKNDDEWDDINSDDEDEDEDDDDDDDDEEQINVTISKFPVQLICMENCENTLDDLILNNELNNDEWFSALMQVIMILITYQKVFSFTHNDLHTNNIMYNETSKKYLVYQYNKKTYKIPTFGRIFKIIDFGRSIYKYQGKLFCSDSFQTGNDAATQYNTEPYFNEKKPRLEPNFSFDLSRLACSIFDYLIEDLDEIKDFSKITDPVKKIIVEWCLDDKGVNLLYKNNGDERYPDFKLYKMIARHVHNHTPQVQLERPEFKQYLTTSNNIDIDIDIDRMPSLI